MTVTDRQDYASVNGPFAAVAAVMRQYIVKGVKPWRYEGLNLANDADQLAENFELP